MKMGTEQAPDKNMIYIKNNLISTVHYLADAIGERSCRNIEKPDKAAKSSKDRE